MWVKKMNFRLRNEAAILLVLCGLLIGLIIPVSAVDSKPYDNLKK